MERGASSLYALPMLSGNGVTERENLDNKVQTGDSGRYDQIEAKVK